MEKTENKLELVDLLTLLQAVEAANTKNAYTELELKSIKPSFDRVHSFLQAYQNTLVQQQSAGTSTAEEHQSTAQTDAQVKIDPKKGTAKVSRKSKKSKGE